MSTTVHPQHDVVVDGMRLRYIDVGPTDPAADADAPPLLIIPGHTARIEGFDELLTTLTPQHRVLVVDLPGSGYSDRPDREYTLRFYEDVLAGFLDALSIGEAVPVGGSLGGNLVLRLGHRWPDRFPRLVAWAPGGGWEAKPLLAWLTRTFCGSLLFWPTVWIQSRFWYSRDYPGRADALEQTFTYYREIMGPGFLAMYWGIAADLLEHSLFDLAPDIAQPTLLLWGDQDNGANMGAGVARIHSLMPACELHVFPGARHSLETEIADQLGDAIVAYLARTPSPTPSPTRSQPWPT